jgi:hypothetical protein
MVAVVTEDDEGYFETAVRCYPPDGRELVIKAYGTYRTLASAQCAADEKVAALLGHECSEACEPWPRALTH